MKSFALLQNFKIWQKLALITGTLAVPIVVLGVLLVSNVDDLATFVRQEIRGVEYLQPLSRFVQIVPQHGGATHAVLRGEQSFRDQVQSTQFAMEEAIRAIDAIDQKNGLYLNTTAKWQEIKAKWSEVKLSSMNLKPEEVVERHNQLVTDVLNLAGTVGDYSNLIYDPVNVSYALQDNLVYRIPSLVSYLGQLRTTITGLAIQKTLTQAEKDQIQFLKGQIEVARALVQTNVDLIREKDAEAKGKVDGNYEKAKVLLDRLLTFVDSEFLRTEKVRVTPKETWNLATNAIDSYIGNLSAYEVTAPTLNTVLDRRLQKHNSTIYSGIAAIVIGTALAILLVYFVSRTISRQATSLTETFAQIGIGNFTARAQVGSEDELGQVAYSLNAMLDNTMALIQSREERDAVQDSIMKLLDEVSGVADGDLTKEAEVTADVMGAVADSFNYMIGQLRTIIADVQKATNQVSRSANEIFNSAQHLAEGSESQSMQIVNTSTAVEEMSVSIQQVSENATVSATVAQQALANARQGNDAVKNTIAGMDRIRDQVQETAKRIKRLGESSQEIGQIIQLIDDIADRTSILALNASIQAAMAGEAGRGFAVVAEEVERLADRSTDATKKISTLVKTIQSETNEAVSAMEKGIMEVVEGSKLASSAGQSLQAIESVSNKLAELIQSISLASKQQAKASEGVAKSMSEISDITQQTAAGTKQAAVAVNSLATLAERLRASVASFRLPAGMQIAEDTIQNRIHEYSNGNGHNGRGHRGGMPKSSPSIRL